MIETKSKANKIWKASYSNQEQANSDIINRE